MNTTSLPRRASVRTIAAPIPPVPPATNATPALLEKSGTVLPHNPGELAMTTFVASLVLVPPERLESTAHGQGLPGYCLSQATGE
ncbi:hypothetical protein SAV14893_007280 [Streptomyces avermitilis]|uniref:Uncharacterized protein n=1 Tax=Streptomyces avermitilis TaxID=33903 RepID=A0A4D4LK22_STRAX|nr:hypothetical protein SAVMC3_19280 [Streptomyces avermitilis]GDY61335.1 hypothetical protein SAV14893_007280 [Streptomyces avermitilis]GDY87409.1 hypothetical protein SAVCW2_66080 [Streptomyces avermitilis]